MEGYIFIDINGREYAVPDPDYWKEKEKKRFKFILKKSGIPKDYWDINFSDYVGDQSRSTLEKCIKYSENCLEDKFHNINLFLVGDFGSQKTMMACNIGKEFIKKGLKVKFIYAGELIDLLMKSQGFQYIKEVEEQINKITNVDLLLLDDIFDVSKSTYWKNSPELIKTAWDKFLRRQTSEDKRIVVTSNFPIDAIEKQFGSSLYQLIYRNFVELPCYDNITEIRRERLYENLWED